MKFFDSHAHYTDSRFEEEVNGGSDALLREMFADSVGFIMDAAVNLEDSQNAAKLASKYDKMVCSAGIFPTDTEQYNDIEAAIDRLKELIKNPKVHAIGEIGLDYHYPEDTNREKQHDFLYAQLKVADESGLPVIFHDRDAHDDSMRAVMDFPRVRGVFHCFSGSREMARQLISLGWYVSFTGVVTYSNARKACEVAREVPADRYLIETDAPYLSPVPHRGEMNRSDYLEFTAARIAELRSVSVEQVADESFENAKRLFRIN